jgi:hypothetical protein
MVVSAGRKPHRADTSVIVTALRSRRGASNRLIELIARGRLRPLVSTALFLEYEEVLQRPENRLATGMGEEDIEKFLAALASAAEGLDLKFRWRPQLRDPRRDRTGSRSQWPSRRAGHAQRSWLSDRGLSRSTCACCCLARC